MSCLAIIVEAQGDGYHDVRVIGRFGEVAYTNFVRLWDFKSRYRAALELHRQAPGLVTVREALAELDAARVRAAVLAELDVRRAA